MHSTYFARGRKTPAIRRMNRANDRTGRSERKGRVESARLARARARERKKEGGERNGECTQARRFFLVHVIRHDVVEINLEARDVLFHGTSGSARLAAKVCYTLAKNEANFAVREYTRRREALIVQEENGLIVGADMKSV